MLREKSKKILHILKKDGVYTALNATISFVWAQTPESWHRKKNQIQHRTRYGKSAPNPDKLIYIDPTNINWLIVPRYIESKKYATYVRGGDWDKTYSDESINYLGTGEGYNDPRNPELIRIDVDHWTFYQSLKNHFVNEVSWDQTEIFEILITEYCRPESRWGHSRETILSRLSEVDSLYQDIKQNGYLTQEQLESRDNVNLGSPNNKKDEVLVNIGRDGEIIFCTGRHRFCVARILELDQIPVRVHVRHKNWQNLRKNICDTGVKNNINDCIFKHPDLREFFE